jgi:transposase
VPELEEMSRDELIVVVRRQAGQLAVQDRQINEMAGQLAQLMEANEALAGKLARLEHLLSRNSGNSSNPPSKDDDPGKPTPPDRQRGRGGPKRPRGKQPGAPGSHLAWTDDPDQRRDRFPEGRCDCGDALDRARDLGVVDRYQQHEIPQVAVTVTQYDQHQVACGCGRLHTAARPAGARSGPVGYGPNLAAFAVYLMVVHFVPAHRVVALLESLTGTAPSVGFVHGMIGRTAGLLGEVGQRIRTLITLAYAVCCDETPLRVGPKRPKIGKKRAERYLLVACTELYTHYLLGDRSLETFKASVVTDLAASGSVIVHDRYQNYDSTTLGALVHQLCTAHLLRDLADAAQVYPDAIWPVQIADALRELIHHANQARDQGHDTIAVDVREERLRRLRNGRAVGLSDTTSHGTRPGERKARLLLEVLRDREGDVLRFVDDLQVPPTSNQAERDLRPSKIQQKISGRLTSEKRTQDRYTILGYVSTAAKHGIDKITALRDALTGQPWMPALPTPA